MKTHYLISSVIFQKWINDLNYTDRATLTMKDMNEKQLKEYLSKISDDALYAYNVYQIEGEGKLFF